MSIKITADKFGLLIDKRDVSKALRQIGRQLKNETKAAILNGGSGKTYGNHQASLPGEAPANLSGQLAAALSVSVRGEILTVTDNAKYALSLEAGAKGGGKGKGGASGKSIRRGKTRTATTNRELEPRPYLSTALEKMEPDIQRILDEQFEKIIKARTGK